MLISRSSFRKTRSNNSDKDSQDGKGTSKTRVALNSSWSGSISVGEDLPKPQPNFSMSLWSLYPQNSHFRGIVFQSTKPIQDIKPFGVYQANRDALKSLKSLDTRLKADDSAIRPRPMSLSTPTSEYSAIQPRPMSLSTPTPEYSTIQPRSMSLSTPTLSVDSAISMPWQNSVSPMSARSDLSFGEPFARERRLTREHSMRYREDVLTELSASIEKLSDDEGQIKNLEFQTNLGKICDVVNQIVNDIPADIFPFSLRPLDSECLFESKGSKAIEVYLMIDRFEKFVTDVSFHKEDEVIADCFIHSENNEIELFCVTDPVTKRRRLSPCKLMIVFAHIISTTVKGNYDRLGRLKQNGKVAPHGAFVYFPIVSEKEIRLNIRFPDGIFSYEVSLVLALDINNFPDCNLCRHRDWPHSDVKTYIKDQGVNLLAKLGDLNIHCWKVSFVKARRTLLRFTDENSNKLRLLLVLQVLNETDLARPKVLIPVHFATILFWASLKYTSTKEWTKLSLGMRFLDLLKALRRCLKKHECRDFFHPNLNLLDDADSKLCEMLAVKMDNILVEPTKFFKKRLGVTDIKM